jgi:predicted transcriptional regulator
MIELKRLLADNLIPFSHGLHSFFGTYADALSIQIIYNEPQNTYTFKKKIALPLGINVPTAFSLYIKTINMGQLIGLNNVTEYQITTEGLTTN